MARKSENNRQHNSGGNHHSNVTGIGSAFLQHKTSLTKYISQYIKHPHDIEDIVHDAFLNSYAAEINTKIRKPRAFLFRTARNLALKHLNKSSTRLTDYLEDLDLSAVFNEKPSLEETVESHEQFAFFCQAVQRLPLQCRRAFILRKVYGLSHREIAEQLDISVSTVEKHLATGISRCSDYLRTRGYSYLPDKIKSERKNG